MRQRVWNVSRRKVGGIWFVKIGRINFSFCVSRVYREFKPEMPAWLRGEHLAVDCSEFVEVDRDR